MANTSNLNHAFGFDPDEGVHHFVVHIPSNVSDQIEISEHFTWNENDGSSPITYGTRQDGQIRVRLVRPKWDMIADEVRAIFNMRLKKMGHKSGSWKSGQNLVRRELGKELILLAWGIEDADPGLIPTAIANWKGFVPEERWWLYTQTAAATAHGTADKGKGWRKALRYALTENPVTYAARGKSEVPEYFKQAANAGPLFNKKETEADTE